MARCLNPITIKNPADWGKRQLRFVTVSKSVSRYGRENIRPIMSDVLTVPCGKCLACLKNKQSSMVVRCLREAEKRGSFAFMTLTYDDDHLPIVESMWRLDIKTGAEEQVEKPDFVSTGFHPEPAYIKFFKSEPGSPVPRYKVFTHCRIFEYEWQIRITPSVCRHDVRQWLKQARIQYERDYGEKLPDFSYVAISEYGPRTCRPHYHLAFFGLKRFHLNYLLHAWRFGKVKQVKIVNAINKDRSNGFLKASKYIGKYMQKGEFECDSVKCGDAERPRVCQSLHFGTKNLKGLAEHLLCFDMVGAYDQQTLIRADGSPLSSTAVSALVDEIPKRLVLHVDDKCHLPVPRSIRDKIFKVFQDGKARYQYPEKPAKGEGPQGEALPSALWSMVAASIRSRAEEDRYRQYLEFCSLHQQRTYTENASEFAYFEAFCAGIEKTVMQEDFKSFYSRSLF